MRSACPERLPSGAARPGPPGPRCPRCLAKCMGLKFLEKEAQLLKVTVSCPPEGGSLSAPGEPGEMLWLPLCAGGCAASVSPSPGRRVLRTPTSTRCTRNGLGQTFWLLQTQRGWGEGTRDEGLQSPGPQNEESKGAFAPNSRLFSSLGLWEEL